MSIRPPLAALALLLSACATTENRPAPACPRCPPPPPPVFAKECLTKTQALDVMERINDDAQAHEERLKELERQVGVTRQEVADALARSLSAVPKRDAAVNLVGARVRVRLSDELLFPSGSAQLSPAGVKALSEVARVLRDTPSRRIEVAGHTDDRPPRRGWDDNWALSSERARQVALILMREGVTPARLFTSGYADTDPVDGVVEGDTARARNRRVELFVEPIVPTSAPDPRQQAATIPEVTGTPTATPAPATPPRVSEEEQ